MKRSRKKAWVVPAAVGAGLAAVALITWWKRSRVDEAHQPRESRVELNDAQSKELAQSAEPMHDLYRFRIGDAWQVALDRAVPRNAKDVTKIGRLFPQPLKDVVNQPLYLCTFPGFAGENLSLDLTTRCAGEGKPIGKEPLGYVSPQIRTGFLMMVRCRSAKAGFYPSLNPRCEGHGDRFHGPLGSIRAAQ